MKNEMRGSHVLCEHGQTEAYASLTKALQEAESKQVDKVLGEMFYGLKAD